MNKPFAVAPREIVAQVAAGVSRSLNRISLLEGLRGVHPIDVKRALISAREHDLLNSVFRDLEIELPALEEIARDDNPILNFWPFTTDSAEKFANIGAGFASIALLGVPTVFNAIRKNPKCKATLFESDDYLFGAEQVLGFVKCDLISNLPTTFNDAFDLVIGDPPWYYDEYCLWLRTATRIARPGATIMFVLFPEGIRDSAASERNAILSFAQEILADVVVGDFRVDYETPSFEKIEMIMNGILPINWRSAELIRGQVPKGKTQIQNDVQRTRKENWVERRVGCGRVFVRVDSGNQSKHFLETASDRSRFLSSPSRRDSGRLRANVISSRGHGLCCNDPKRLIELIEAIHTTADIEPVSASLDEMPRQLFKTLASDLWSRFIALQ